MRFFNTAGLVRPDNHYAIQSSDRVAIAKPVTAKRKPAVTIGWMSGCCRSRWPSAGACIGEHHGYTLQSVPEQLT